MEGKNVLPNNEKKHKADFRSPLQIEVIQTFAKLYHMQQLVSSSVPTPSPRLIVPRNNPYLKHSVAPPKQKLK